MERQRGYYWVKLKDMLGDEWVPAYYTPDNKQWQIPGNELDFYDRDFLVIGSMQIAFGKSINYIDMYTHIGTSYSFVNPDGKKVYLRMTPTDHGSCELIVSIDDMIISRREIVNTAGHADLQVQSGTKWAGEQIWAGILEAELQKRKSNG